MNAKRNGKCSINIRFYETELEKRKKRNGIVKVKFEP